MGIPLRLAKEQRGGAGPGRDQRSKIVYLTTIVEHHSGARWLENAQVELKHDHRPRLLLSSSAPEAGSQGLALLKRLAEQSADGPDLPIDVAVSWLTQMAFGERCSQDVAGSGRRATSAASSAGRPKSRSTPSAW